MTGPNNSLYVDHSVNEVMPTARDMEMAAAREAIRAAERRGGRRRHWRPARSDLQVTDEADRDRGQRDPGTDVISGTVGA